MPTLEYIRKQYPQYGDLTDGALADKIHSKFYADMPLEDFDKKIGFQRPSGVLEGIKSAGRGIGEFVKSAGTGLGEAAAGFARGEQIESEQRASIFGQPNAGPPVPTGVEAQEQLGLHKPEGFMGSAGELTGLYATTAFMGPEGLLPKALTTVAGGVGAAAGREIGGTTGELIGGFAGGATGGMAAAEAAERSLARALPGRAANETASRAAYTMIQNAGVQIDPNAVTNFLGTVEQNLASKFITRAGEGREIFPALDKAKDGDLAELMDLHSRLGQIRPNRGELYEAAVVARPQIRDFIENLQHPQLLAGNPQFVSQVWQHARDTWRIHAKLSEVEQAAEAADIRRLGTGRGMNWNTFRQEFKKILLSDDKTRGYSDEAIEKIEKIVKGTLVQNAARYGSVMAPQRGVLGAAPAAIALAAGGIEPAGIVASIGEVSHLLEGYLTRRQIKQLEDLIKRESPLAPKQKLPDRSMIAPTAAVRSALVAGADSPLAGQYP